MRVTRLSRLARTYLAHSERALDAQQRHEREGCAALSEGVDEHAAAVDSSKIGAKGLVPRRSKEGAHVRHMLGGEAVGREKGERLGEPRSDGEGPAKSVLAEEEVENGRLVMASRLPIRVRLTE